MTPVWAALAGVTGLSIGSFLNVVAYRVPRGLSVVSPGSACPGCGSPIQARDNVPVLSWLALGRKCRTCKAPISARYPLIEAVTGVAFVAVALLFAPAIVAASTPAVAWGAALVLVAHLLLAALTVALAVIDFELRRLPNPLVATLFIGGVVLLVPALLLLGRPEGLLSLGVGAAASFVFYLVLALISPRGMGMGDVKLAGALGVFLGAAGWAPLFVGVFAAFAIGTVAGIVVLALRRSLKDTKIPFGPWMLAGTWVGIVGGDQIAAAYLAFVGLG